MKKIDLAPLQSKIVEFILEEDALSFFSEKLNRWTLESGEFNIMIGASSQDIRYTESINI